MNFNYSLCHQGKSTVAGFPVEKALRDFSKGENSSKLKLYYFWCSSLSRKPVLSLTPLSYPAFISSENTICSTFKCIQNMTTCFTSSPYAITSVQATITSHWTMPMASELLSLFYSHALYSFHTITRQMVQNQINHVTFPQIPQSLPPPLPQTAGSGPIT